MIAESRVRDDCFVTIQGWMRNKLKLKGNEVMIFAIINGFSQDGISWCDCSLKYYADWTGACKKTVEKIIDFLVSKNYVIKEYYEVNHVKYFRCKVNFSVVRRIIYNIPEELPKKEEPISSDVKQNSSKCGMEKNSIPMEKISTNSIVETIKLNINKYKSACACARVYSKRFQSYLLGLPDFIKQFRKFVDYDDSSFDRFHLACFFLENKIRLEKLGVCFD